MTSAPAPAERTCPRVIGATDDTQQLVTCGETIPCPYHDAPLYVVANPTSGGDQE